MDSPAGLGEDISEEVVLVFRGEFCGAAGFDRASVFEEFRDEVVVSTAF